MYTVNHNNGFICTTSAKGALHYATKFAENDPEYLGIYSEDDKAVLLYWESPRLKYRLYQWSLLCKKSYIPLTMGEEHT